MQPLYVPKEWNRAWRLSASEVCVGKEATAEEEEEEEEEEGGRERVREIGGGGAYTLAASCGL